MLEIIIVILTLSILIILHELGHFLVAKKFDVRVEEFGLGFPPRLFSKKIGETIYSFNLIPFGGFVKMFGEEEDIQNSQSFTGKPIWQRALIVFAGVAVFWIIAIVLLTFIFGIGAPIAISDDEKNNLTDIRVQIAAVASGSPAEKAGLRTGDTIINLKFQTSNLKIDKVKEVQEFIDLHKGQEVVLMIERGGEIFDVTLIPRIETPRNEGAMGVALVRTAIKSYPWSEAPIKGILATASITEAIIRGLGQIMTSIIKQEPMPPGIQLMGPVGIFDLMGDRFQMGIIYFLKLTAIITIHLAIFNLLPIPALDGGKLLFLGIEAVRGKPISQRIEQSITLIFFFLLISLMIFVTIQDIIRIF
jgi:regulator of sigma E protease